MGPDVGLAKNWAVASNPRSSGAAYLGFAFVYRQRQSPMHHEAQRKAQPGRSLSSALGERESLQRVRRQTSSASEVPPAVDH